VLSSISHRLLLTTSHSKNRTQSNTITTLHIAIIFQLKGS